MLNERYGDLLDNVMNKKDTKMIDTAERLTNKIIADKLERAEAQRINSNIRDMKLRKQSERERLENSSAILNKWIDTVKSKHEVEVKQAEAKKHRLAEEQERREVKRKAIENLNWQPSSVGR